MTILEVILALAILGTSIAAIGELSRLSFQNAQIAADETQSVLFAESVLAKAQLGIIKQETVYDVPVGQVINSNDFVPDTDAAGDLNNSPWLYSLEVNHIEDGVFELAVTVRQNRPAEQKPVECRLVRWVDTTGIW